MVYILHDSARIHSDTNDTQSGGSSKGVNTVTRIMNVDEVARYLGVVPDTIYRKARRGEIPAVKMGKVWRFPKETLDKWLNDAALETVKKS